MNKYKLTYKNGKKVIIKAENVLQIVKKFDLASIKNIDTKVEKI